MRNADMPAMPNALAYPSNDGYMSTAGLTKREYFAALAMQGLLAFYGDGQAFSTTAKEAMDCADALLAELERSQ